jgi:hypothetical protein
MDSYSASFFLYSFQELVNDLIRGCATVQEVQVNVFKAGFSELGLVVLWFVQSDNEGDAEFFEDGDIVVRCERTVLISHIEWTTEG